MSHSVLHLPLVFIASHCLENTTLFPNACSHLRVRFILSTPRQIRSNKGPQWRSAEFNRKPWATYIGAGQGGWHEDSCILDLLNILKCFEYNKSPNVLSFFIFSHMCFRRNITHMLMFPPLLNHENVVL